MQLKGNFQRRVSKAKKYFIYTFHFNLTQERNIVVQCPISLDISLVDLTEEA